MSGPHNDTPGQSDLGRGDIHSALFAQLVMQQTNMAMMLLGKVANPETGKVIKDLDAAQLFIDQLDMLEVKTKGNLTKEEAALLKQSLMNLRLAFVEAVEAGAESQPSATGSVSAPTPAQGPAPAEAGATGSAASAEEEHRKKFSKKY